MHLIREDQLLYFHSLLPQHFCQFHTFGKEHVAVVIPMDQQYGILPLLHMSHRRRAKGQIGHLWKFLRGIPRSKDGNVVVPIVDPMDVDAYVEFFRRLS